MEIFFVIVASPKHSYFEQFSRHQYRVYRPGVSISGRVPLGDPAGYPRHNERETKNILLREIATYADTQPGMAPAAEPTMPAATQPVFQDTQLGFVTFASNVQHQRPAVSKGEQTRDIEVDCTSTQTLSTAIAEVCGLIAVTSRFGDVTLCGGGWIGGTSGTYTTK